MMVRANMACWSVVVWMIGALISVAVLVEGAQFDTHAGQLMGRLFGSSYDPSLRPAHHHNVPTIVNIDLKLYFIESLDWVDEHLMWDPADYGGIGRITVSSDKLWRPDVLFLESAEAMYADVDLFASDFPSTLNYDGHIVWSSAAKLTSLCPLDMTYFPFDLQHCHLSFGSWASLSTEVKYQVKHVRVDNQTYFSPNREFEIVESKAQVFINSEEEFGESVQRSEAEFSISLRRLPLSYILNIFGPCILISVMTPFTFLLSPESGDRVSLSVTLLLTFTVYLLVLGEVLPPGGQNVPLILLFILCCLGLTAFALFIIILLGHLQANPDREPKGVVRSCIMRCLAPVFCHWKLYKYENRKMIHKISKSQTPSLKSSGLVNENANNANVYHIQKEIESNPFGSKEIRGSSSATIEESPDLEPEVLLEADKRDVIQWIAVTKVLDRFFFFFFVFIIIILDVGFLVLYRASAP